MPGLTERQEPKGKPLFNSTESHTIEKICEGGWPTLPLVCRPGLPGPYSFTSRKSTMFKAGISRARRM